MSTGEGQVLAELAGGVDRASATIECRTRQVRRWNTRGVRTCEKAFYVDQDSARVALSSIREKAAKKGKQGRLPVRVYPCDVCDGWHLTAKPVDGRTPPWDRDPDWIRPKGTAHLQQRSAEVAELSRRRKRAGAGR